MTALIATDADRLDLERLMAPWAGTPHMPGVCLPGARGGCDCVQFAAEVIESMYFMLAPETLGGAGPRPRPAQDRGIHLDGATREIRRWFLARFSLAPVGEPMAPPPAGALAEGDLVEFAVGLRVNHVGVVGMHGRVWHADRRAGVVAGSLHDAALARLVRVAWRPDRDRGAGWKDEG